jgi:hypothetical protein
VHEGPRACNLCGVDGSRIAGRFGRMGIAACMVVLASAVGLAGCGTSKACTAEARFSLVVTVVDGTGKRVCNASVKVRDGRFSAVISPGPGVRGSCVYRGVPERKGTYTVEVRSGAKSKIVDDLRVSADGCHVHPRSVTVVLDR